ncbi:MAG: SpoIIE family protein phosphatase [Candidatus Marinimicrobia bacterium]|nr:SpoIIE family protein phosphatase [Candidatus Neomarinimicrobiota bacterium]MCF7829870.1 SpoIIE family protein phosphatase [Candidatus Neomarinimicrobiota bacterium]MCF7879167.1 SpoIIE family protein phosphatase [Candidatus Neomarinimicrobiota bacterium]
MNNQTEIQQLRAAVQELGVLNDIATAISSVNELDEVIELIVLKCVKHFQVEQGAVMLLDDEDKDKPFQTMIRQADASAESMPYHLGVQLSGWMIQNQQPLLVNDFESDSRFVSRQHDEFPIRSILGVPLRLQGEMMGILIIFNKQGEEGFTKEDQRLLSIIAAQSAQVIENARLYEEEQELIRMEEDLRVARDIQVNLLPKSNPDIPGYDIAGISIPAKKVGGDYYDFIRINEHRWAFCLGDISGKGIPASLLMANLQATLRSQTLFGHSCKECLERSNLLLYRSTDLQKFATLFYVILDAEKNHIEYSKAGHEPPFLISGNLQVRRLNTGGTILGFREDATYEEEMLDFAPGDSLVIYSDGITDAMNEEEEHFGEDRFEEALKKHHTKSAEELIEVVIESIQKFVGDAPQLDDMTLLVIRREKT